MNIRKIATIKSSKPVAWADIILAAVMTALIIMLLLYSCSTQKAGTSVEIYINNSLYGSYDLMTDQRITVSVGKPEDGLNVIVVISGGYVEVEESNTPKRICEFGKINKSPQQLICLPHNLVVMVVSEAPPSLNPDDIVVG